MGKGESWNWNTQAVLRQRWQGCSTTTVVRREATVGTVARRGLTAALCLENWDKLERLYEGDETILKEVYQNED